MREYGTASPAGTIGALCMPSAPRPVPGTTAATLSRPPFPFAGSQRFRGARPPGTEAAGPNPDRGSRPRPPGTEARRNRPHGRRRRRPSNTFATRRHNLAANCARPLGTRGRLPHYPTTVWRGHGQGHRKADPSAVAHLVPDGRAASGHRSGDPARRRGLQRDERGRVRAPLLRGPLGARGAADLPVGREAGRRARRAGDVLARAGELPPAGDRVHRPGARRPPHRAAPARRRVRVRRAAPARASADLVGPPEPADLARAAHGGARDHRAPRADTS